MSFLLLTEKQHKFDLTAGIAPVFGLQLQPATTTFSNGARINLCAYSGICVTLCLDHSGRNSMDNARDARIRRTSLFRNEFPLFRAELDRDLSHVARKHPGEAWVRLNTFSDVLWENKMGHDWFKSWEHKLAGFYDYTKWPLGKRNDLPDNYHLTYSWSEKTTEQEFTDQLNAGRNVAVTMLVCTNNYKGDCRYGCHCPLPSHFKGVPVIDGDKHDARFTEPPGHVIGLRFKRPRGGEPLQQIIDEIKRLHAEKKQSFVQIPG